MPYPYLCRLLVQMYTILHRRFTETDPQERRLKMREIVSYHPEKPQHWVDGGLALRSLLSQDHAGTQSVLLATGQGESALQATQGSASLLPSGAPINEPAVARWPRVIDTRAEIDAAITKFNAGKIRQLNV